MALEMQSFNVGLKQDFFCVGRTTIMVICLMLFIRFSIQKFLAPTNETRKLSTIL